MEPNSSWHHIWISTLLWHNKSNLKTSSYHRCMIFLCPSGGNKANWSKIWGKYNLLYTNMSFWIYVIPNCCQFESRCPKMKKIAKNWANFAIMSYGHFSTTNGLKIETLDIWIFGKSQKFPTKCKNNFGTLDNFRPFLVGKWP